MMRMEIYDNPENGVKPQRGLPTYYIIASRNEPENVRRSPATYFFILVFFLVGCLYGTEASAKLTRYGRPDAAAGSPTIIHVALWVIDIDSIDSAQQNFVASVFVKLRWNDKSLAHRNKGPRVYELDQIWNPRVQIANEIGLVRRTMPEIAEVDHDGTVNYRQRYVGPFSQQLKLHDFPFDRHAFHLHLVAAGYSADEVRLVPDEMFIDRGLKYAAGIAEGISLPDWKILGYETKELPYEVAPGLASAGYAFVFKAERYAQYYVWKIILPLVLIVLMSWSVFLIDPTNAGTKIGVATSAMLTLIAYRFVIETQVPRVPYLTRLDIFIFASTLLILSSLFMVTMTAFLVRIDKETVARRLDQVWRVMFLVVFGFILIKTLFS